MPFELRDLRGHWPSISAAAAGLPGESSTGWLGLSARFRCFRVWMFWRYIVPPGHCDIKGNGTSITTHVGPSEAQAATSFTLGNACGLVLGGGARMGHRQMVLTGLVVAIGSSLLLLVASRRWMSRRSRWLKNAKNI